MKILVTHVPAGSGHERSAQAVVAALHQVAPSAESLLIDASRQSDRYYQWAFTQGYPQLITHAPSLWALAYYATDWRIGAGWIQAFHHLNNVWHGKNLYETFLKHQADVIITTHFFPVEVAAFLKSRGKIRSRLIVCITDYRPHTLWIAPGVDWYVAGSAQTEQELIQRGVAKGKIKVFGIPIDPKFALRQDRAALVQKLALHAGRFTILIASGGLGTGKIVEWVHWLEKVKQPLQLLIVTGKNVKLFKELVDLTPSIHHALKVYGFVDNMDELMEASDLLITKPGGLTCAEALTKGLPMILTEPIPGQESRNADFLLHQGLAMGIRHLREIPALVEEFLHHPEKRDAWLKQIQKGAYPNSALDVARLATQ